MTERELYARMVSVGMACVDRARRDLDRAETRLARMLDQLDRERVRAEVARANAIAWCDAVEEAARRLAACPAPPAPPPEGVRLASLEEASR